MSKLKRFAVVSAAVLAFSFGSYAQEVVAASDLKAQAVQALRSGDFSKTADLLRKASEITPESTLTRMAEWTSSFSDQRKEFSAKRHEEYLKALDEMQKVKKAGFESHVIDLVARAALLSEDKDAFRALPWVEEEVTQAIELAGKAEEEADWVKATRLYADLSSVEPFNPLWKEKLKQTTRRIRLLFIYAPDQLKEIRKAEQEESDKVLKLILPESAEKSDPENPEAAAKESDDNDAFRIDWKDQIRGIKTEMLWAALSDARTNYWRDLDYNTLMLGGIEGLRAVATTEGLDKTFASLADGAKKSAFVAALDAAAKEVKDAPANRQPLAARSALSRILSANSETLQLPNEVIISEFADGALAPLDPFSNMIWPAELEEFAKSTQGEFSGVGIQIESADDGSLTVVSPIEDSPAFRAGIKAGDIITHINGQSAKGVTTNQAVKTITGPGGTTVELTVRSLDGNSVTHTLKREVIKVASVKGFEHLPTGGWNWMIDPESRIAYIRLTSFTRQTTEEIRKASREIKSLGASALIFDLRYNGGGLLSAATEVSDKFLKEGVIVSTRADRQTPQPPSVTTAKNDFDEIDLPVVVLVNQFSASASEIVSGALKDQKRALVVGERTFGKGSVQMLFPTSDRTAYLKLTTSHYYLPGGRCIHREDTSREWGVDPDVRIEMTPEQMRKAQMSRRDMDVLRSEAEMKVTSPAENILGGSPAAVTASTHPSTQPKSKAEDLLATDAQLSAALLLLRLELSGVPVVPTSTALAQSAAPAQPASR